MRRFAALAVSALVALAALAAASSASASPRMLHGLMDDAQVHFTPEATFDTMADLRPEVLRVQLWWKDVAPRRPANAGDPGDLAYDWTAYDRTALLARDRGIRLVFTIIGTPGWANGGKGWRYAPSRMSDLKVFSYAAARRYSGRYADGSVTLPLVNLWTAWNEPNYPVFLRPQWQRVRGRRVPVSPRIYAKICNATRSGIKTAGSHTAVGHRVACGVTKPTGRAGGVAPLVFLRGMRAARAKFDAYAHHPYPTSRFVSPKRRPASTANIALGNIDVLFRELNRLYGRRTKLWITEYGYQTNPPDRYFGVSWRLQASYLRQAFTISRRHPRIDMFIWFLVKDEPQVSRWQSGLMTYGGTRKPSYAAFKSLPR